MRKYKILLTILTIIFIVSCSNDDSQVQTKTIKLKFENNLSGKSKSEQNFTIYDIIINSLGEVELNNENLELVDAIEESTQKQSFMIIEKNSSSEKKSRVSQSKMRFETGYFFDGECFVYGTMIYGDNGVNLFVACGINCIGFDNVCPGWNEAFV